MSFGDLRHENIGALASAVVFVVGCWIVGWEEPSEGEAAAIVSAAFILGAAVITALYRRDDRRQAGGA